VGFRSPEIDHLRLGFPPLEIDHHPELSSVPSAAPFHQD
jgi:hypothetical protein